MGGTLGVDCLCRCFNARVILQWDPKEGVFFIWGDTDFDSYGPRNPPTQMHNYIFNQIVPQLVIGDTLVTPT